MEVRDTQRTALECVETEEKTRDTAEQGEQTSSDMKEIDIPHPWPRLKEMLEIVGSKNSSWQFL